METLQRMVARQWTDAGGVLRRGDCRGAYRIDEEHTDNTDDGVEDNAAPYDVHGSAPLDKGGLLRADASKPHKLKKVNLSPLCVSIGETTRGNASLKPNPQLWRPADANNLSIDANNNLNKCDNNKLINCNSEYSYEITSQKVNNNNNRGTHGSLRSDNYSCGYDSVPTRSDNFVKDGSSRRRMTIMWSAGRDFAQQFQQPLQKVRNTIKERFPSVGSLNSAASSSASSLASFPASAASLSPHDTTAGGFRTSPSSPSLFGAWNALKRVGGKSTQELTRDCGMIDDGDVSTLPSESTKIAKAQAKINGVCNRFKSKHAENQNLLKFDELDNSERD